MSTENLKPVRRTRQEVKKARGASQASSETSNNCDSDILAAIVKRTIVFTALAGYLPMNWATWLIQHLKLEAA